MEAFQAEGTDFVKCNQYSKDCGTLCSDGIVLKWDSDGYETLHVCRKINTYL